jgi:5-formyltetrahydrofolate cyclo-ligase
MDKKKLRNHVRHTLASVGLESLDVQSKKACQNLLATSQYKDASVVMLFLSLPFEIETAPIFLDAWQKGKTVAVPKISWQQRHMIPVEINSLDTGLSVDNYGVRTPVTGQPIPQEDIDLIITPGLAFDEKGGRLGRGGAYYDTFFASKMMTAVKLGFCFSQQLVQEVPMTELDHPVDIIVTDEKVIEIKK